MILSILYYASKITYMLFGETYQLFSLMSRVNLLDGKCFEVYLGDVVIGFGNLNEETGESVTARIYGGKV